ncbi:anaerobic glycerol-3-phosphate dehydrogenase subunit GlpA [Dendrosporobacter sp. 1207_IL3150]|uniref:anaerobic glycerol-3-phosphate dehydrogenase subunit GlpA n=1 Tax=Dendrosporobacter sp. 1207_IL3150 TaxID=3084054 RepID=UPI002FDB8AE5
MQKATVVVIGGGATGVGILRDLCMRGVDTVLVEQRDLAHGTSSRYHGLLHSGGRYAVKDAEAGKECIEENIILRKIGRHCVEATEGFFVRTPEDSEDFEVKWVESCRKVGIPVTPLSVQEALRLEPNLNTNIKSVYRIPDAAIDGFRMVWQNVASARKYGGRVLTYTEVISIESVNGQVVGVKVRNAFNGQIDIIQCDFVVSAAGSWAGQIAEKAGIKVNVQPDRGTLIAFNHRIASRVINRLRPAADGDIFVPHGSITILGTTSSEADRPDDTVPSTAEIIKLLDIGAVLFENIRDYRILRAFTGTRPLYSADPNAKGRGASRNFVILDHADQGLKGFVSIVGGKFTTYRLMAEKVTDLVCSYLNVKTECRTAIEPIIEDPSPKLLAKAKLYFPAYGTNLAASRLGADGLEQVVKRIQQKPEKSQLLCECENVTLAEVEEAASDSTSYMLSDVRRKTRMGMGTCQGAFCTYRSVGAVDATGLSWSQDTNGLFKEFLQARWNGIRPVLWGNVIKEAELTRGIYDATLNINGAIEYEK